MLIYPKWSSWAAQKKPIHYLWISCLVISRIQILVALFPQKAGKRFLSHFALWSALKPYQQMKSQLSLICMNTKKVKLFALSLLFTHIYSPWVVRISVTCLIHLSGPSGGDAEMMILRCLNSLWRDVACSLTSPELPDGAAYLFLSNKTSTSVTCLRSTPLLQSHKEVFNIRYQFPLNACVEAGLGFTLRRRSRGGSTGQLGPLG